MKNMFWVINKEKVYAYVVSILTIVTLFFMSHILNEDWSETKTTSTNTEQNVNVERNIDDMNNKNTKTNNENTNNKESNVNNKNKNVKNNNSNMENNTNN